MDHEELMRGISELDLTWLGERIQAELSPQEGTADYLREVLREYRRFLALKRLAPDKTYTVPSSMIDKVWHLHILDTRRYAEDCQTIFGYFLHHNPGFGTGGAQGSERMLAEAWDQTTRAYREHFGEPQSLVAAEIWKMPMVCG